MQQQIAVVTLGVSDLERSKTFYREGFGWTPVFANAEIAFYQMNGFVFGTWLKSSLEEDTNTAGLSAPGSVALAHNVPDEGDVRAVMETLVAAGATVLRDADTPPQGGFGATSAIRKAISGKSRGTPRGQLTRTAMSSSQCDVWGCPQRKGPRPARAFCRSTRPRPFPSTARH